MADVVELSEAPGWGQDFGQAAWLRRYREAPPHALPWNETVDTILSHRSVRAYLADPLPAGALETALAAAQSASSSSSLQAWSVIVVDDPALKTRLNALAGDQKHIDHAPVLLVWLADLARLRGIADSQALPSSGLDYLEAFVLGVVDAALAAQSAAIALESLGLGTCYIGGMRNHPEEVARELGLPPEAFAVFGMTVGIPDPVRPASVKPRLPQRVVVHRNGYTASDKADLAAYNRTVCAFQAEQAMPVLDWTIQASRRVADAAALHNRDRLGEAIRSLGFRLR